MKILYFGGGLGNQIFEYFFYSYLSNKFKNHKIYGIYWSKKFEEHKSGLEIEKVFNVKLPPTSIGSKIITVILFFFKKIFPNNRYCSLKPCETKQNALIFNAFKTNKKYYENLDCLIEFRPFLLGNNNEITLHKILSTNSVSIHIRRGDFLSPKYYSILANIATIEYYRKAIEDICLRIKKPHFFIFSDDIEWARKNIEIKEAIYVTWNTGTDSFKDMYLMSQCKANIIANSTFSYWSAYLNKNKPIVYYPIKWINSKEDYPDIFPDSWIGIESN